MTGIRRTDGLTTMGQVLNVAGTRTAPAEVDIASPVQPVFDLSESAIVRDTLTVFYSFSAVANASSSTWSGVEPREVLSNFPSAQEQMRNLNLNLGVNCLPWLVNAWAQVGSGTPAVNLSSSLVTVRPITRRANYENVSQVSVLVRQWNIAGPELRSGGALALQYNDGAALHGGDYTSHNSLPMPFFNIDARTTAGAGGQTTVTYTYEVVFAPLGWIPPGYR